MEPTIINPAIPSNAKDGILEDSAARSSEPLSREPAPDAPGREGTSLTTFAQMALVVLGAIAFLYFARPVVLPIVLAVVAAMTLKPLVRWLSECHLPPAFAAAIVLCVFVSAVVIGFLQLGRPAVTWMNEGPAHITQLRQRVERMFPRLVRFSQMVAAVNNLGATEQSKATTVEVKTTNVPSVFINWTGAFLAGVVESLVLLYLLLASGDLFLQKLVRVMPTFSDKKRAVEISRETQQNITNYLFSVSLINIVLGLVVSGGLFWMGVPNAVMWGVVVACLNYIPYFGPIAGMLLLGTVGFLTFDTLSKGLLPAAWYLGLHLLESYLVTPVVLGSRFTLNPVVIFVSLMFWTWLWGVPGALLAVPILVSIKVICDRLPSLSTVCELLSS